MNEDYLRFLSLDYMGLYPNVMRSFDYDDFFIPVRPVGKSFIKQELKPHSFLPEEKIFQLTIENITDEDMEYFKRRLMESLRVPHRYFDNNPQLSVSGYDEFH